MSDLSTSSSSSNVGAKEAPPSPQPPSAPFFLHTWFKQLRRIKRSQLIILIAVAVAIIIFTSIIIYLLLIGQKYRDQVDVEPGSTRQLESGQQTFVVKKITLKRDGQVYEFNSNGIASKLSEDGVTVKNRHLFSNDQIWALFNSLTKEEFEAFISHYYSADGSYTIIIETSFGTKTIVVDDSDPGSEPPPDDLGDIVDDIDDIVDDLNEPPPSPPPSIPPTPTPPPASPTPSPTPSASPTPTPSPGSTPAPAEPFRCDMLQNQINDVTVSNTVCVPPSPTP